MNEVGLEYLTLDRLSSTLSGGEAQRIQLATSLGSRLVGTLYVLDEPSIGLHPSDRDRLLASLRDLIQMGMKSGPSIKRALAGLLRARLDKQVITRQDEMEYISKAQGME